MVRDANKLWIFVLVLSYISQSVFGDFYNKKIISLYGGYTLETDGIEQTVREYIEPAANAGFNAIEFKLLAGRLDRNNQDHIRRLQELCDAVKSCNMRLLCYTYADPWNGKRCLLKDKELPVFVSEDGLIIEDRFPLIHWQVFEKLMHNAFELAHISNDLPIEAVKIDLESIHNLGISYDDESWKIYAAERGLNGELSIQDRLKLLNKNGLKQDYYQWFSGQMSDIAVRFREKMHEINPELTLGFMPAHSGWFYEAFIKKLSTSSRPAIMDSWILYNISGFSDEVLVEQKFIKNLNKHNIYVPWFRINNYYPEDIGIQAYHTAMNCNGYSGWALTMLEENQQALSNHHKLPATSTPTLYWQNFTKANKAIKSDVLSNKKVFDTIAYKKIQPVAPVLLGLENNRPPELEPVATENLGMQFFVLRDQQEFDIFAGAGEIIEIDVKHLAGSRRAVALQYVLMDSKQRPLRRETVSPDAEENIKVPAPQTGSYRFVITGGEAGMAWFGVKIHNPNSALRLPAYIFFTENRQFWLRRTKLGSKANVVIKTNHNQLISARLNEGEKSFGEYNAPIIIELDDTMEPQKLSLLSPEQIPQGKYVQDFLIGVEGDAEPYLYDGPKRGVRQK